MRPQISFKISCDKKIQSCLTEPIMNTVNNTNTIIDLNLKTNHLMDQPFSRDQIRDKYSAIKKEIFNEVKEI